MTTAGVERQWDRPEIGARLLKTFLMSFEIRYGRERLEALWRERPMPLSLDYLAEPNNWISLDFLELLFDELVRGSGDPDFMTYAGKNIATPEALGFAYYILRGVGSPMLAYRKTVESSPDFNRAGRFEIEQSTPWSMTMTYKSLQRAERNRNSCLGRMANFAAFPTIWGLPRAQVIERQCQVNGADCCRYELSWQNPPPGLWRRWLGAGLGAAASFAVVGLLGRGLPELVVALAAAGFGLGAWRDVRRLAEQKDALLEQTTQGMRQSLMELQERADVIHKANVELDQRVTERTAELSAALERLRQLDALKSEFFANVSHELRTPLTLILAPLDDRLSQTITPEERRLLEGLRRNASRLLRLIDDLLDLSRIDAGQLRLDLASLDMGAMARQLGTLFASAAEARGIKLVVEGLESTTDLWGDSHRLDSALSNLLGNAFKFTPAGGAVTLRVEETDTEVKVTVKDTGPGIAPADLPRIFERYYQAEEGATRRVGGVGIGLALARNLVELHGGRLSVESELGHGAAFTISLRRGKAHISPEVLERRRVQVEGAQARRASDAELEARPGLERGMPALTPKALGTAPVSFDGARRGRVLVVEDNPDVRAMLVDLLSAPFEVMVAPDGTAGLEAVKKLRPDLVLSDVMMPGLSGTQLCQAIKADPVLAATPVILLTARGGTDAAIEGFAAGADEFVEKPFHPRVLVARVQAQLRLRSLSLQVTAQARLAAVGTLAAGVGHEVRNPVNAVLNGVRALQDRPGLDETDQRLLEVIADGAERINVISGALLTHVSPGDGGGLRPVDPRAGLDSTLRLLEHRLVGIEVHRDYSTDAPVVASAAELNQIFVNLLDNGIRSPAKHLWVEVKEAGEKVHIVVADDGPGVPLEIASRLFDPFFTTRSPGEGTGLGLYLSKQSLLRWGGDLRFAPRPGGGTAFTVELPRGTQ
ncbi:MAG: ATP-binding protein [Archangium sp.]|nr:ATP-binding protein [Archangium sp.]